MIQADDLLTLDEQVIGCRACPRLVAWRETNRTGRMEAILAHPAELAGVTRQRGDCLLLGVCSANCPVPRAVEQDKPWNTPAAERL